MTTTIRRWIVALVGLFSGGFVVAALATGLTTDDLLFGPSGAAFVAVGSVLALRVPDNKISWLVLGVGASMMAMGAAEAVLEASAADVVSGVILFGFFIPSIAVLIPLWFPTGRPPSLGWVWVAWAAVVGVALINLGQVWKVWLEGGDASSIDSCTSPGRCISVGGLVLLLVAVVGALVSLVARWRRSDGVERMQLRWLVPAFIVLSIGILAEFGGFQDSLVASVGVTTGFVLVPVAIGLAILRYRLYDIDRVISRTVSYMLIVGLLGLVFAVGAVWIPQALGIENPLFVAVSTLFVAALFNPLRSRVQRLVDRRFNRSRYDAERVIDHFAGSLSDRVDPDDVVDGWVGVVSETMQPETVGVWVRR